MLSPKPLWRNGSGTTDAAATFYRPAWNADQLQFLSRVFTATANSER
jgi:hypothetical protein